ncbi:hypothetical protein ACFSM5_08825 [Lacibacterium aquatile]|uniref:Uncharacterized protein n=1 Tax=Lacibacterium aquatile TaxID=1168082 RepID=A0ABW5DPD8_9PROT
MKIKNGAEKVLFWRNRADVTLVLARGSTEVGRCQLPIDPQSLTGDIWHMIACCLRAMAGDARRDAHDGMVIQPVPVRDPADGTAHTLIHIPFGPRGDNRLEIASNLYPLPEAVRTRHLSRLADEFEACARLADQYARPALEPAA